MALARIQKDKAAAEKKQNELQMTTIKPGDAANFPKRMDSCAVHYIGYLADGTMFDNSYERGQAINFVLGAGQVIPGWENVMPLLSRGARIRLTIPPHLAYGDRGYAPIIPPKAHLTYELELLSFTSSTHMNIKEKHQKVRVMARGGDGVRLGLGARGQG